MRKPKAFILASLLTLFVSNGLLAQDVNDLLLYSQNLPTATARSVGVGSAMGAIGGDFSTMSMNPAGLAFYRSHEAAGSLNLGLNIGTDIYRKRKLSSPAFHASMGGLSFVFNLPINRESQEGLVDINFGISYTELANYSYNFAAKGTNPEHSYLDVLTQMARDRGLTPKAFDGDNILESENWFMVAARKVFLFEPYNTSGQPWKIHDPFSHFESVLKQGEVVEQEQTLSSQGYLGEIDFSTAFNISNRLYIGATIGIQDINRSWTLKHSERVTYSESPNATLDNFSISQKSTDEGSGVNFKLGVVVRANDYLRLGAAIHTPTFISIQNSFKVRSSAFYKVGDQVPNYESPRGINHAKFFEPLRALGSVGVFLGSYGFLSADYVFTYTPLTRFSDAAAYSQDNDVLAHNTLPMHEVRAGAEILLLPFVLRLGGGYQTSPYKKELYNVYGERLYATVGFGIAFEGLYWDIAYRHLWQNGEGVLYSYRNFEAVSERRNFEGTLLTTIGFRF